ncbi:MAG TPA: hypothetical protein VJT84_13825 [Gaiellaceae bacterium]|nr:hypothetical protein [Gaiellaceae bacterium]
MNRVVAGSALIAFLAAMAAIAIASATSGNSSSEGTTTAATRTTAKTTTAATTTAPAPKKPAAIALNAVGAYDPEGDQHENDDLAPLAVDGDPTTFWRTEHYRNGFFKKGVGLVLDAGRRRPMSRVVVSTDEPGSSAQIELGNAPTGPFRPVSTARPLTGRTTFALEKGASGRYVVVWMTALPKDTGEAHVTAVHAVAG